ncbi:hypothetical protein AXF14_02645 [Actinomyces radicidentis]|uniref:Uncharacterized protein n=1 Tax=Actinomyces radicidentis TaxID=111015 RepID=A0A0X8JDQ8_ACTRD|nr:hypothetical protein [Actinomyces radicidentis]AMD86699.1 hypothetical protein AXF14_02645 [Actinomyces radicidentis]
MIGDVNELLRLSSDAAAHLPLIGTATLAVVLTGGAVLGHLRRNAAERAVAVALALVLPVLGVLAVGAGLVAAHARAAGAVVAGASRSSDGAAVVPLASRLGVVGSSAWSPQGVPVLVLAAAAAGACIGLLIVTARNREQEIHDARAHRLAAAPAEGLRGWGLRVALVAGTALLVAGMIGLFAHDVLGAPTTWSGLLGSL